MSTNQLDALVNQTVQDATANASIIDSAIIVINGIQAAIDAAVKEALAAGATAAELQAVTDVNAKIEASTARLAAAIPATTTAAGTPAAKGSGTVK